MTYLKHQVRTEDKDAISSYKRKILSVIPQIGTNENKFTVCLFQHTWYFMNQQRYRVTSW